MTLPGDIVDEAFTQLMLVNTHLLQHCNSREQDKYQVQMDGSISIRILCEARLLLLLLARQLLMEEMPAPRVFILFEAIIPDQVR